MSSSTSHAIKHWSCAGRLGLAIVLGGTISLANAGSERFRSMGQVKVTAGGETHDLWVPYDTESGQGYARKIGFNVLFVEANGGSSSSGPGMEPTFDLALMTSGGSALPTRVAMTLPGDDHYYESTEDLGARSITHFAREGERWDIDFEAELVPHSRDTREPIAGAEPLLIAGEVSVTLP